MDLDQLATEFGVSITPVRDAIRLLEKDGLVVVQPRRGVFTAAADVKAFRDVFEARIALECLAVETAARRIPDAALAGLAGAYARAAARLDLEGARDGDEAVLGPTDSAIHDLIVQHADNDVVRELMESLRSRTAWAQRLVADRAGRYRQSFAEHRALLEALRARDTQAAQLALRTHLERARDHTLAALAADAQGTARAADGALASAAQGGAA